MLRCFIPVPVESLVRLLAWVALIVVISKGDFDQKDSITLLDLTFRRRQTGG